MQSKNPSALLVIGQRLPSLLRDNLSGRMCSIHEALGKQNTSAFTLASLLNKFLQQRLEELFDSNDKPTSEFLRRVRNFIGDLRHFQST